MISTSAILWYSRNLHARVQISVNTHIVQKKFLIFFLTQYNLANDFKIMRPRDQGYSLANTNVKKFLIDDSASALTEPSSGNQPMLTFSDTSSETNPGSQDQTWIEDVESLSIAPLKTLKLISINFLLRADSSGDHHHQQRRNYPNAKNAKNPASAHQQHMNQGMWTVGNRKETPIR